MVPMWTIPISLTCGNCVILKPSEKVPLTMQRIASLMTEAGIPAGVFQIVHGAVDVVTAMCDHPDIAAVSFVGSSKVADIVAKRCHAVNKRVIALGGAKNHLIALPDCDVGMASRDIVASFAGCCGQRCMAASALILVDEDDGESKNDELLREIVSVASKLQPGQVGGQVGPLIDNIAKTRVLSYIKQAEETGAKILLDGRSWANEQKKGFWVGPTITLHTNKEDRALLDEIFGPVLSVIRVATREEAIAIENANPYGNAACIYSEKGANAEWFTKRFRAAMLGVNIGIPVPREPFSFGGLYGTLSKYGNCDITGDGAMEFFTNRIKITSKWTASYGTSGNKKTDDSNPSKKAKHDHSIVDKANFDGKM
jgi:malonate-semialdehyde dehydrogenase (acetylating)/methylmalonate-semialdehyde dehydrogenase